ncbi:MAG: extensin-like protein [Rhizobium sp.]|nr:extensin-like protein [Rhizobium sp.]
MSIAFPMSFRRACLPTLLSLALSACSGQMVPPADIDGATTVSSIEPSQKIEDSNYSAPEDPASRASENADYLNTPNLAGVDDQQAQKAEDQPLPMIDEEPTVAKQSDIPENGVNMDSDLGAQPTSLAEEEADNIAEGNTEQPVVDGIGTETLKEVNHGARPVDQRIPFDQAESADQVTLPTRRRDPDNETQVAFIPRFSDPSQVPESYGGLTVSDRACRTELTRLGVRFRELEPISNGRSCGIPHPIEVSGFASGITLRPAAKLNCNMTRTFAKWVKNELVPTARYRYFSGIKEIHQLSSYSCRKMNSRSNNPWSEHAKGNAIDIGGFILKSGKEIDVRKKSFFAFREKGLLKAVRSDSCKYFNSVLGPGDAYHGDHFHFDMRYRKSGYRHCSL